MESQNSSTTRLSIDLAFQLEVHWRIWGRPHGVRDEQRRASLVRPPQSTDTLCLAGQRENARLRMHLDLVLEILPLDRVAHEVDHRQCEPRRDAPVNHKKKDRLAAEGYKAGRLVMAHAQGVEAAGRDAGVLDRRVLRVDVVAQGPTRVGAAASDGTVAWGMEAGLFMGQLLRERDHLGAPMLLERARHGQAAEDALQGAAVGVGGPRTQAATVAQIGGALEACDMAICALRKGSNQWAATNRALQQLGV